MGKNFFEECLKIDLNTKPAIDKISIFYDKKGKYKILDILDQIDNTLAAFCKVLMKRSISGSDSDSHNRIVSSLKLVAQSIYLYGYINGRDNEQQSQKNSDN